MFDTKPTDDNTAGQKPSQQDDLIPDEILHSENKSPKNEEQVAKADVDDLNAGKDFPFKKVNSDGGAQKPVSSQPEQTEPVDMFEESGGQPKPLQDNFPNNGIEQDSQRLPDNLPDQLAAQEDLPRNVKKGNMFFVILIAFLTMVLLGLLGYWFWTSKIKDNTGDVPVDNSFPELEQKKELDDILSDLGSDFENTEKNIDVEEFDYDDFEKTVEKDDTKDQQIDTDGDGLFDYEELIYGTNPNRVDSDFDGLGDQEEIMQYKTDPNDSDSDSDSYPDGIEVKNGYDPLGLGKLK
jgi:hypothetical protein